MNLKLFSSRWDVTAYSNKESRFAQIGLVKKEDVFILLKVFFSQNYSSPDLSMLLHPELGICYVYGYITDNHHCWCKIES